MVCSRQGNHDKIRRKPVSSYRIVPSFAAMPHDIRHIRDIELLVDSFYAKARRDEHLGPVFNTIIGDDWSHHLPVMYRFWSTVLFGEPGYSGQVIAQHISIDRTIPLEAVHYKRWETLFVATVDELFSGPKAEEAKKRAGLMLQLIRMKVEDARGGKTIL